MIKTKPRRQILLPVLLTLLCCVLLISGAICLDLWVSSKVLTVSEYSITTDKHTDGLKIAVVADLHNNEFGDSNSKLFDRIRELSPDLIAVVGDIVNNYSDDLTVLTDLLDTLPLIAPTYFSLGNHEDSNPEHEKILTLIRDSDCVFVDDNYEDVTVNGTELRIGGINYYRKWDIASNGFIADFCDTERFTLLLCHKPELYIWGIHYYPIDLTVSGHTHGGQVILPGVGGVYAPEQGKFPEYDYGLHDDDRIAITRGLGTSPKIMPRFGNPPEIMVLNISGGE